MTGRRPLRPGLRMEILMRDGFTCRYCGRSRPFVTLEVDHVIPVSLGGGDGKHNLVTACHDCNQGKRAKYLGGWSPPRNVSGTIASLPVKSVRNRLWQEESHVLTHAFLGDQYGGAWLLGEFSRMDGFVEAAIHGISMVRGGNGDEARKDLKAARMHSIAAVDLCPKWHKQGRLDYIQRCVREHFQLLQWTVSRAEGR